MSSDNTITPIDARTRHLLAKLDEGYAKIGAAQSAGEETAFLEQFWMDLLSEYDAVCRTVNGETPPDDD